MYIHHVSILIEGSEDLSLEQELNDMIQRLLSDRNAALVSTTNEELAGHNYGRCVKCGTWASDLTKENRIRSFSNGVQIEGDWFCDLCLPEDHPNSF